ncbi:hypothetical protein GCM10011506_33100 [Marivirga lumbricoides]|uniref:Pentapeptide repeat-containing protein n=1 Tax=Marivirga lumbricoides TaxID=1046115 RepID=A0ABQ1MR48_9BACT|nr:hypothetical protein GCM10011506_33100 [Marivirga lumbricoides]
MDKKQKLNLKELSKLITQGQEKFENIEFRGDIWLDRNSIINRKSPLDLNFLECEFESLYIDLKEEDSVEFVNLKTCTFGNEIIINGTQKSSISIRECQPIKKISLMNCGEGFNFKATKTKFMHAYINHCQNTGDFLMKSCGLDNFEMKRSSFLNIQIDQPISYSSNFSIIKSRVDYFKLSGGNYKELKIEYSRFLQLEIINGLSIEFFRFINVTGDNLLISGVNFSNLFTFQEITFSNSKFLMELNFKGDCDFTKQNLDGFVLSYIDFTDSKLSFKDSIITTAYFFNILWPENYLLYPNYQLLGKDKIYGTLLLRSLSEQYRQLKLLSEKSGDKLSSLKFYNHEMKTNLKVSLLDKNLDCWDILLLRTNKWFSDFGLSYVRPVIWLFSVHILIFTLFILIGYNDLVFVWPWKNFDGIGISFGQYFYLLNPLHKLPTEGNGWILVLDFFSRIINSYFIYYFIKATRKFS